MKQQSQGCYVSIHSLHHGQCYKMNGCLFSYLITPPSLILFSKITGLTAFAKPTVRHSLTTTTLQLLFFCLRGKIQDNLGIVNSSFLFLLISFMSRKLYFGNMDNLANNLGVIRIVEQLKA